MSDDLFAINGFGPYPCYCDLYFIFLLLRRKTAKNLPPGPSFLSSNLLLLSNSLSELEPIPRNPKSKYGPPITLFTDSRPSIFVGNHSLAHQVLIQIGAIFFDHPRTLVGTIQHRLLLLVGSDHFNVLGIFPRLGKILFRNRWKELLQIRSDQERVLIPLIKSRIETTNFKPQSVAVDDQIVTYVDTIITLHLPKVEATGENGGKLTDKEMVSICSEFLNVVTDTASTALQ
ncbi:hypothetical protein L6452_38530 [Arctium lappa]|uniref:Uncharacterized protein n=1 Tax=Arctium lappa TaxID=4217 RepID=A0ACB8XPE2_ARCLA|nr:hypothetical protein L6452_38530 [Arctium lappa]